MLSHQEVEFVDSLINGAKASFEISNDAFEHEKKLFACTDKAVILKNYTEVYLYNSLCIAGTSGKGFISVVQVNSAMFTGKRYVLDNELQLIGLKKLDRNYGHIIIRPETFEDKINELFNKQEIDLKEFPKFSSRYYFLAKDEFSAHSFAIPKRLELIEAQKEVLMEVMEDVLLVRYARKLNEEDLESMIQLIKGL